MRKLARHPKINDFQIYDRMHNYFRHHKASFCSFNPLHVGRNYEWALIGDKYTLELKDYKQLCVQCHRRLDMTEYSRRVSRDKFIGNTYRRKAVIAQRDNKEYIFDSLTIASDKLNVLRTAISNCLAGKTKTAGGYSWEYAEGGIS